MEVGHGGVFLRERLSTATSDQNETSELTGINELSDFIGTSGRTEYDIEVKAIKYVQLVITLAS